jgi:hypothetical protein
MESAEAVRASSGPSLPVPLRTCIDHEKRSPIVDKIGKLAPPVSVKPGVSIRTLIA